MLLLRALFLWSILSLQIVGGAALFRRFFPRESPWLGFIIPSLAFVIVLNFIEHMVGLPALLWLLPVTTFISIWAISHPKVSWKGLRLPTGVFLTAFVFALVVRAIRPDITNARDGVADFCLMTCFCQGEKLPPTFSWLPPFQLYEYYVFGHYALSMPTRLLGIDAGTGFNFGAALRVAFDSVMGGAVAWTISRHRIWITILAAMMIESAATGATAYLWLTTPALDPNTANTLSLGMNDPANHNPLWNWLQAVPTDKRHELMPPGTWAWLGTYHSTAGGQTLIFFFILSVVEVLRRKRTNWPWICLGVIPLVSIVTSTWAVLLEGLLLLCTLFWIWRHKFTPQDTRFVLLMIGVATAFLIPILSEFLTSSADFICGWTPLEARTQFVEFLVQWWPIFLPALALLVVWRKLHPAVKTIMIVFPIAFSSVEVYTMAGRPDWTSKLWGDIYGASWIVLFPAICMRRAIPYRILSCLLLASCMISFVAWGSYTWHSRTDLDVLHLEGDGAIRLVPAMGKLRQALLPIKGQTIITGKSNFMYCSSPMLAAFTDNRTYVTWSDFCESVLCARTYKQALHREVDINNIYDGKCDDPLLFLRMHDIAALVIYPEDRISAPIITGLKRQLAPYYVYSDFSDEKLTSGIFIFDPKMISSPVGTPLPPTGSTLSSGRPIPDFPHK